MATDCDRERQRLNRREVVPECRDGVEDGPHPLTVPRLAVEDSMTEMRLYDLRVTVERIEGRSVCGLEVGDFFEVTESSRVRIPEGRHFCLFAIQAVLPLLPAKMRRLPDEDWLEQDNLVCCPDPEEGLVMRIERIGERALVTEELT
jgi:uncharacterized repeat protein (TIGR04076 family)